METANEKAARELLAHHSGASADTRQKVDAADLAKYRALGEMLAALVAPQLDADVARAVAAELDARDTDDRANDDRDRERSAEIADAVEAAVTDAQWRLTDQCTSWLSPDDITAVLNAEAYAKIAKTLVDGSHLTVDVDVIYPEATLIAG
tara:strand:- start:45 stop:494 length:450 start_codon:yes stop_codon:yes gene_type:complete